MLPVQDLYEKYKNLILNNPQWAQQIGTFCRISSYILAGRFQNSFVLSELISATSNLLALYNEHVIRSRSNIAQKSVKELLELTVTVLEYVEVFLELVVSRRWAKSPSIKWTLVWNIQILKTTLRLILLLHYQTGIQPSPPCDNSSGSQSQTVANRPVVTVEPSHVTEQQHNITVKLERSGKVMRKLTSNVVDVDARDWKLPVDVTINNNKESILVDTDTLAGQQLQADDEKKVLAECLHICKPIAHLGCLSLTGATSWLPWLTAATCDITSLYLMKDYPRDRLQSAERSELERRHLMMLLYFLRSPCYDSWTKERIMKSVQVVCRVLPGGSRLFAPIVDYLAQWQRTYFYLWSN